MPIAERVRLGIERGSHLDEAGRDRYIVPFPAHLRGRAILDALTGGEGRKVYGFRAHGYLPTIYETRDEEGRLLQVLVRFDHATERKVPLPLRYCGKGKNGQDLYWFTWIPGAKPLYGLDQLAARPNDPVLIVEGEKTVEAARKLFPDMVVITWPCGANAVRRAELLRLAGRYVKLWPDNDATGRAAMRVLAARALQAGAPEAAIVIVPPEFGLGWDLANPIPADCVGEEFDLRRLLDTARPLDPEVAARLLRDPERKAAQRRVLGYQPGHSGVDPERVAEALAMLDPDMPGPTWRATARCIYLAFGAAGLPIFDAWSANGDKYKDGEPARMWDGFAKEAGFAAPSLAWLFRKARRQAEEDKRNDQIDAEAFLLAIMEEMSESHAVVTRGSKTWVMAEKYDPLFDRYKLDFLDKRAFVDKFVQKVPLPAEGDKPAAKVPLGSLWFGSGRRRQYDGIYFAPGRDVGRGNLNIWRGFAVEPADNPAGWALMKAHILHNICGGNQAAYDYILNWKAFSVQRLAEPVKTALVLQGAKGAGKTFLTKHFGYLFGAHYYATSIADDIFGRFNEHLEDTLLLGVEEAFAPQNRAADGVLKDIVNSATLRIEAKFHRPWLMPNHLCIIMTSNNDHVVRADGNERRYAVFEVTNPHIGDPDARRRYFGAIAEQLETGGYEAMLGELLARDIRGWNPEAIPETEALRRQKQLTLTTDLVQAWYYSRLEDGNDILSGDAEDGGGGYRWSMEKTVWVPVRSVVADFAAFARRHGKPGDDQRLKNKLARYMPDGFGSKNKRNTSDPTAPQAKHYPFPPLPEARRLFAAATGHEVPIADDADEGERKPEGGGPKPKDGGAAA